MALSKDQLLPLKALIWAVDLTIDGKVFAAAFLFLIFEL